MEVNTLGVFLCCRACVPHMRQRGWGRIINLASPAPLKGIPYFLHYVASKGAVIALTRALARELGRDGIAVNAMAELARHWINGEWAASARNAVAESVNPVNGEVLGQFAAGDAADAEAAIAAARRAFETTN